MADYDVGALALTVPPAKAVITSYRPAVSVRNNGIHDALASGTLRCYKAGLLVFTTEIYSPTIPPGETKSATATDYWTPPSVGTYQVIAYVSCPLDQFEPNNALAPTLVTVTAEPPPPAPTVTLHANQHEEGGTDELSIDGLGGRAKDPQVPFDHVTNHETGGDDVLDVTGLHGQLADGQPTTVHGNEKHSPPFATPASVAEVVNSHNAATPAHAASTNLEHTANKGAANGYASLDTGAKVPPAQLAGVPPSESYFLRADQTWQPAAAGTHAATHQDGGPDEISIAGLAGLAADRQTPKLHAPAHQPTGDDVLDVGGLLGKLHDPQDAGPHVLSHQVFGPDELNVNGLHGVLVDHQPPGGHNENHEHLGNDEINVAGLHGKLAEPQTPVNHTASSHDTSVEATAHKGAASGYCELDAGALVPVARIPAGAVPAHATTHQDGGSDKLSIAGLSGKAADAQTPLNHGATHGHEGGDDISIGGLSGMPAAAGVALGLATLDIDAKLTPTQVPAGIQLTSEKGAANGYAPLDAGAKVPVANLPAGFTAKVYIQQALTQETHCTGTGEFFFLNFPTLNQLADNDQVVVSCSGVIQNPATSAFVQLQIVRFLGADRFYLATVPFPVGQGDWAFRYEGRISLKGAGATGQVADNGVGISNEFFKVGGGDHLLDWDFTQPYVLKLLVLKTSGETCTAVITSTQIRVEKVQ